MKTLLVLLASVVSALADTVLINIQPANRFAPVEVNGNVRYFYLTNADPNGQLFHAEWMSKSGWGYYIMHSYRGSNIFVLDDTVTSTTNGVMTKDFFPFLQWLSIKEIPPKVINISVKYTRTWLSNGWYYVEFPVVAGQTYLVRQNLGGPPTSLPFTQPFIAQTNGLAVVQSQGGFPMAWVEIHPAGSYPMPPPSVGGTPLQPEVVPTLKTNTVVLGNKYPPPPPPVRIKPRVVK